MAPPEPASPSGSSNATPLASPIPPPLPLDTHPNRGAFRPPSRASTDPSRLAPEDAYKTPPRLHPLHEITGLDSAAASAAAAALRPAIASLRPPPAIPPVAARLEQERRRRQVRRKRRPRIFKKLLWIRSEYPDNYTDTATFLDHLERNPRLKPYDFWPLVANSAVIVQHVCSLAIFVSAYAAIYQDRLSPVAVVTCGTIATLLGWILWDKWIGEEEAGHGGINGSGSIEADDGASVSSSGSTGILLPNRYLNGNAAGKTNGQTNATLTEHVDGTSTTPISGKGLGLTLSTANLAAKNNEHSLHAPKHGQSLSKSSFQSISPIDLQGEPFPDIRQLLRHDPTPQVPREPTTLPSSMSHRNQVRLKTLKSALLIYFALLGLSPILKSLTKSTSSDSIWALATWLLIINVFFFDYGSVYVPQTKYNSVPTIKPPIHQSPAGGQATPAPAQPPQAVPAIRPGPVPPFPSSLSTNAALMASTVLASRLPTTTAVFSLSLFSIQVFGLFPVFRRYLRYKSIKLYMILTLLLIFMSTAGLSLVLSQSYTHTHGYCGYCFRWIWHVTVRSVIGVFVGGTGTLFIMGACSWWLIGMQRYKDVVIGPWDPAKPVLAGGVHLHGRGRGGTE